MNFRPSEDFHSNYITKLPLKTESDLELNVDFDPQFKIENHLPKFRSERWMKITQVLAQKHGGYICQLCRRKIMTLEEITHDHIEPRSKGGKYALFNLQLAHKKCNAIKGSRTRELSPEYYINWQPAPKLKKDRKKIFKSEHDNPDYWKMINEELRKEIKKDIIQENHCAALWNEIITNKFQNLSYEMFHRRFELYAQQRIEALEKNRNTSNP